MKTVDVLLTGQVVQGVDVHASAARLARLAGIDQHTALRLLNSGRLTRIKKGVEATTGLQYFRVLSAIGAEVLLSPADTTPSGQTSFPVGQAVSSAEAERLNTKNPVIAPLQPDHGATALPRLGPEYSLPPVMPPAPLTSSESRTAGLLQEVRAAVRAVSLRLASFPLRRGSRKVAIALPHGPRSRRSDDWLTTPRQVPASLGWEWLRQSWMQFTEQLGLWLLCFFLCCGMLGLLFWVPGVHIFAMVVVLPVLLGALMLVAHRRHQEEPLGSLQPLAATLQRGQGLLLLGFFSLLFLLFLGAAFFWAADFGLLSEKFFTLPNLQTPDGGQVQGMVAFMVLLLLVFLVLAGYLFAIPLILFTSLRPLRAFQLGVYGSIKNWRAMLVALGVVASVLCFAGILLFALQQALPWLPRFVYILLMAALVPPVVMLVVLFVYHVFRNMFAVDLG